MRVALLLLSLLLALAASAAARGMEPAGAGPLAGTSWILAELPGHPAPSREMPVTMHFEGDRIHGSDGCNRYSGLYVAAAGRFRGGENLLGTKRACPEPLLRQADAFLGVLRDARAYVLADGRLALLDEQDRETAVFAVQSGTLSGTAWTVTGYNNGKQAVVGLLPDSEITAVFQPDGRLAGSAGCNPYSATYEVTPGRIRIEPAAAGFQLCPQPAGLMEQEALYLDALRSAAGFRRDGRKLELRTADGALAVRLAETEPAVEPSVAAAPAAASPARLRCGDLEIALTPDAGGLRLTAAGDTFELRHAVAASGARYVAADDPTTSFWSKGEGGLLEIRGIRFPPCRPLTVADAPFRARGQEPGWHLELDAEGLRLGTDDGQTRVAVPTPPMESGTGYRRYTVQRAEGDLTVTILDLRCTDTMTGRPYPRQVELSLNGTRLTGCGGDPAALLQGVDWVVEDIAGTGIVDRSRVTLRFAADGSVSGRASCNTYRSTYTLTGETLSVAPAATTRMACAPALMRQEATFLAVLADIRSFGFAPDGALLLSAADGRTLTARGP